MIGKVGYSDKLVLLKKPFDNVEVLQLACALTEKWRLALISTVFAVFFSASDTLNCFFVTVVGALFVGLKLLFATADLS